MTVLGRKKCT